MYRGLEKDNFNIYNRIPSNAVQSYELYFLEEKVSDNEFKMLFSESLLFYEKNFKDCEYFSVLPLDVQSEIMYEWMCKKELPKWYLINKHEHELESKNFKSLVINVIDKWKNYEFLNKFHNPKINTKFLIKHKNYEITPNIVANPQLGVYVYFIVKDIESKISNSIYNAVKDNRVRLITTDGNAIFLYNAKTIDDLKDEINIIKSICIELKVTQKELAELIGISENTIGSWARGITETPKWAHKIFELLKIEMKYNKFIEIN